MVMEQGLELEQEVGAVVIDQPLFLSF